MKINIQLGTILQVVPYPMVGVSHLTMNKFHGSIYIYETMIESKRNSDHRMGGGKLILKLTSE